MYHVEFAGGKITELSANIIAELMYSQWNAEGYEYLLFDALVDYHRHNKAISLLDQQIIVRGRKATY